MISNVQINTQKQRKMSHKKFAMKFSEKEKLQIQNCNCANKCKDRWPNRIFGKKNERFQNFGSSL